MKAHLFAAMALGIAQAAQATANLDTRSATVHLAYGGGFATAGKNATVGSLEPIDIAGPPSPQEAGADSFTGGYLGWAVSWQMDWQIGQTWSLDHTLHTLSGSGFTHLGQSSAVIGPGCTPCTASVAMTARNWQDLQFTLDQATAFVFHSEVSQNQGVQVNRWDESRQRWIPVVSSVAGGVADRSGTLDAGRWQVVNSRTAHVLGSSPASLDETWLFSLMLPNTLWIAPVPEPGSASLLLPGLLLLARQARRAEMRRRERRIHQVRARRSS